jgi:AcrR family transcriptional regulator
MRTRRSRAESNELNRREVLEAARRTFLHAGYHGASLDAIALEAGFSKGVIYSQFGSKDDLFLTLLGQRIQERRHSSVRLAESLTGPEGLVQVARQAIGETTDTLAWQTLLLEFRAHAARHPEIQARYAALHEETIAGTAEILGGVFERAGVSPPMPLRTLAVTWVAIGAGLAAELLVDPDLDARAIATAIAASFMTSAVEPPRGGHDGDRTGSPRSARASQAGVRRPATKPLSTSRVDT